MRALLLLFSSWCFLLSPALCEAGWLSHVCLDHADEECGHEEDCVDDPCTESALRPESLANETSFRDLAFLPSPGTCLDFAQGLARLAQPRRAPRLGSLPLAPRLPLRL